MAAVACPRFLCDDLTVRLHLPCTGTYRNPPGAAANHVARTGEARTPRRAVLIMEQFPPPESSPTPAEVETSLSAPSQTLGPSADWKTKEHPQPGQSIFIKFDNPAKWYHGVIERVLDRDDEEGKTCEVCYDDGEKEEVIYPGMDLMLCPLADDARRSQERNGLLVGDTVSRSAGNSGMGFVLIFRDHPSTGESQAKIHFPKLGTFKDKYIATRLLHRTPWKPIKKPGRKPKSAAKPTRKPDSSASRSPDGLNLSGKPRRAAALAAKRITADPDGSIEEETEDDDEEDEVAAQSSEEEWAPTLPRGGETKEDLIISRKRKRRGGDDGRNKKKYRRDMRCVAVQIEHMQEVGYNPQHPNSKPWIDLVLDFREISAPDTKSSSANGDRSAQEASKKGKETEATSTEAKATATDPEPVAPPDASAAATEPSMLDQMDSKTARRIRKEPPPYDQIEILVKFFGKSHYWNSWINLKGALDPKNYFGTKKVEKYAKKLGPLYKWKAAAEPEELEVQAVSVEMERSHREKFSKIDRVVNWRDPRTLAAPLDSTEKERCEYFVKWLALPYSECSWEPYEIVKKLSAEKLNDFFARRERQNSRTSDRKRAKSFPKLKEDPGWVKALGNSLRDYQRFGVQWMGQNFTEGTNCILADEMGLGKTIQTISLLGCLSKFGVSCGPFLVISPLSALPAWEREFHKWAPFLNMVVYKGNAYSRDIIRRLEIFEPNGGKSRGRGRKSRKAARVDVVLTTYEFVSIDKSSLGQIEWKVLAVDEAHRLKNPQSRLYKSLSGFSIGRKLLITGTPLQNSLKELWSLLNFLHPDKRFGTAEQFEEKYQDVQQKHDMITSSTKRKRSKKSEPKPESKEDAKAESTHAEDNKDQKQTTAEGDSKGLREDTGEEVKEMSKNEAKEAETEADKDEERKASAIQALHKTLEPYLLRRIKKDVLSSLPQKIERILHVEMSPLQKTFYQWILARNFKALNATQRKKGKANVAMRSSLMSTLTELKKCCNHCYLFPSGPHQAEKMAEADMKSKPDDEKNMSLRLRAMLLGSGKMTLLDKLLMRLKETGHRVLIFSQMVRMLDVLSEYCILRRLNFQRLDGTMPSAQRQRALEHFNKPGSPDFLFLLSTRAGGLGINLHTADTVIIFDSDWNPQNDLQALARCHRIGQRKTVNTYRLVTKHTVEEEIVERAKKKMILDHLVIQRMDTSGTGKGAKKSKTLKASNSKKAPLSTQDLSRILRFGARRLFKPKVPKKTKSKASSSKKKKKSTAKKKGSTKKKGKSAAKSSAKSSAEEKGAEPPGLEMRPTDGDKGTIDMPVDKNNSVTAQNESMEVENSNIVDQAKPDAPALGPVDTATEALGESKSDCKTPGTTEDKPDKETKAEEDGEGGQDGEGKKGEDEGEGGEGEGGEEEEVRKPAKVSLDDQIDSILQRTEGSAGAAGLGEEDQKKEATEQFLSNFKVASFEGLAAGPDVNIDDDEDENDQEEDDTAFWESLIPKHLIPKDQLQGAPTASLIRTDRRKRVKRHIPNVASFLGDEFSDDGSGAEGKGYGESEEEWDMHVEGGGGGGAGSGNGHGSLTRAPASSGDDEFTTSAVRSSGRRYTKRKWSRRRPVDVQFNPKHAKQIYRYLMLAGGNLDLAMRQIFSKLWKRDPVREEKGKALAQKILEECLQVCGFPKDHPLDKVYPPRGRGKISAVVLGKELNAVSLLTRIQQMETLKRQVGQSEDPLMFMLPEFNPGLNDPKWDPPRGLPWGRKQDSMLLVGVYIHGLGAWDDILSEQKLGLVPHLCLPPLRPTSLPAAVPLAAEPYAQHQPIPQGPPPPYEEEGEEAGKAIDLTELLDDKQTNQQTGLPSPSLPTSTSDSRQGSQVGVIGWEENGGASDVQAMVEDKDVGNRNQPDETKLPSEPSGDSNGTGRQIQAAGESTTKVDTGKPQEDLPALEPIPATQAKLGDVERLLAEGGILARRAVGSGLLRSRVLLLLKRLVSHERNVREREQWIRNRVAMEKARKKQEEETAMHQAHIAFKQGNFQLAIYLWSALLQKTKNTNDIISQETQKKIAVMHFNRGMGYMHCRDYKHALRDFKEAHKIEPANQTVQSAIAQASSLVVQEEQLRRDLEKAQKTRNAAAAAAVAAIAASAGGQVTSQGAINLVGAIGGISEKEPDGATWWKVVRKGGLFIMVDRTLKSKTNGVLKRGETFRGIKIGPWIKHERGYSVRQQKNKVYIEECDPPAEARPPAANDTTSTTLLQQESESSAPAAAFSTAISQDPPAKRRKLDKEEVRNIAFSKMLFRTSQYLLNAAVQGASIELKNAEEKLNACAGSSSSARKIVERCKARLENALPHARQIAVVLCGGPHSQQAIRTGIGAALKMGLTLQGHFEAL
ncbi:hypothetical protein AAMO2058_000471600 [Amorphochlora amoebiformis]